MRRRAVNEHSLLARYLIGKSPTLFSRYIADISYMNHLRTAWQIDDEHNLCNDPPSLLFDVHVNTDQPIQVSFYNTLTGQVSVVSCRLGKISCI